MNWELYSYVIRSKYRRKILLSLSNPKTPSQLADELSINLSHVSRALKELEEKMIVECLTPKVKVGRIYRRTKFGEEIAQIITQSSPKARRE